MKKNLYVISFGQTGYYFDIANDLLKRFKKIYPFSNVHCYSDDDLPIEIINYSEIYKRGYGYWQWKPYIILKQLHKLRDGELLLYIDGRSHVTKKNANQYWLKEIETSEFDMVLNSGFIEKNYTSYNILKHFGVENDEEIRESKQYFASLILMRKSEETVLLIEKWYEELIINLRLFRDDDNNDLMNFPGFVENRHDQSALSVLLKKSSNLRTTSFYCFSNTNIIVQFKFRRGRFSKLFNWLRMYTPNFLFEVFYRLFRRIKLIIKTHNHQRNVKRN